MQGRIERFSGLEDAVSDMNEFAHHSPDNKLGRFASRRKTVAEKFAPSSSIEGDHGRHVERFTEKGMTDFGKPNEGVNEGVNQLLAIISKQPGLRTPVMADMLQTSPKNIERWLKQLKDTQRIEYRGAPKTGGYYILKP